jgi:hypothetical protein
VELDVSGLKLPANEEFLVEKTLRVINSYRTATRFDELIGEKSESSRGLDQPSKPHTQVAIYSRGVSMLAYLVATGRCYVP